MSLSGWEGEGERTCRRFAACFEADMAVAGGEEVWNARARLLSSNEPPRLVNADSASTGLEGRMVSAIVQTVLVRLCLRSLGHCGRDALTGTGTGTGR